jgi:hypothetical protein
LNKALLQNLHEMTEFQMLLKELKQIRPIVPNYNWKEANTEEIKAKSCLQQGFDLALSIMTFNGEKQ